MIFLFALIAASPLALAQPHGAGTKHRESSSQSERAIEASGAESGADLDAGAARATGDDAAGAAGRDEASTAPDRDDSTKTPQEPSSEGTVGDDQSNAGVDANPSPPTPPIPQAVAPPDYKMFQAPIKIGGKEVSCRFQTFPGGCRVGGDLLPVYYPALEDKTVSGDLELPETVMYDSGTELKVLAIDHEAFKDCVNITSTGLERNRSITNVRDGSFNGCISLTSTGLENNDTVDEFAYDNNPKPTGAFEGCTGLGISGDRSAAANAGDLVLNQPSGRRKLKMGTRTFFGTKFTTLYLLCDGDLKPTIAKDCLPPSIKRVFVPASWIGTTSWQNFKVADGTLVIMAPVLKMTAERITGTSDVAGASLEINRSFTGEISDSQGHVLKRFAATRDPDQPTQIVHVDTDGGTGLASGKETLSCSSENCVYPESAVPRRYNTSDRGSPVTCALAAVTYAIRFDGNGSTGGSMKDLAMTYDVKKALSANAFSKTKNEFTGWNTKIDGTGDAFDNKQQVMNLNNVQGGTVELHAQWKSTVSMTLKITGSGDGAFAGYVLSGTEGDREHGVDNVFTDAAKKNKVASWPQSANAQGVLMLYGVAPGTYYLYNTRSPAGFGISADFHSFTVNDNAEVVVDGQGDPKEPAKDTIELAMAYKRAPVLPSTGSSGRQALQTTGTLMMIGALGAIAICARCRN